MTSSFASSSRESIEDPPPPPPGASCYICLEEGADDGGKPILRNCACRGSAGYGHVSCIAENARRVYKAMSEKDKLDWGSWTICPNCNQQYVGNMAVAMADAFVESVAHLPETDVRHFAALEKLADTRFYDGNLDGAQELCCHLLDVLNTSLTLNDRALAANVGRAMEANLREILFNVFAGKGEIGKANESLEKARLLNVSLHGPLSSQVARIDQMLNFSISNDALQYDTGEQVRMSSQLLEHAKRKHGKEHIGTLRSSVALAMALSNDGKFAEAIDLLKDTLGISRRVLGATHPDAKEWEDLLSTIEAQHQASRSINETARSRAGPVVRQATIIRHPNKPDWNGKQVKVSKATNDGKFIVSLDIDGNPGTKFKAAASNLVFATDTPVLIHGLVSRPDLNRKRGRIRSFDEEKNRYVVSFEGGKVLRGLLKPENLQIMFSC